MVGSLVCVICIGFGFWFCGWWCVCFGEGCGGRIGLVNGSIIGGRLRAVPSGVCGCGAIVEAGFWNNNGLLYSGFGMSNHVRFDARRGKERWLTNRGVWGGVTVGTQFACRTFSFLSMSNITFVGNPFWLCVSCCLLGFGGCRWCTFYSLGWGVVDVRVWSCGGCGGFVGVSLDIVGVGVVLGWVAGGVGVCLVLGVVCWGVVVGCRG